MKTFKVIGLLVLVFAAGFAGGVVATKMLVRQMVAYAVAHPAGAGGQVELHLDRSLHLDQKQRTQVHQILKDSRDRLRGVREEFQPKFNGIVLETRTNILAVLTPDQQDRFQEFLVENRSFLPVHELPPLKKKQAPTP